MVTKGHGGHEHSAIPPEQRPTSFNDPKITQDEEHLREHLKDEINMPQGRKMSPEEMEFHYFRLHDTNNDTHLDGVEIMQGLAHMMPVPELEADEKIGKTNEQQAAMMAERYEGMRKYYEDLIDRVLHDDDVDKDGYLTYSEFARARRREEFHLQKIHQEQMRHQQMQFEQFQQFQAMQAQMNQAQMHQAQMNNKQGFQPTIPPPPQPGQQQQQQQYQQHGQPQLNQHQQFNQQQQQQYKQPR